MEKLTRFEITRLVSARALQLSLGAPPLIKASQEMSPFDVAKKELETKILPLSIIRVFPDGKRRRIEIG